MWRRILMVVVVCLGFSAARQLPTKLQEKINNKNSTQMHREKRLDCPFGIKTYTGCYNMDTDIFQFAAPNEAYDENWELTADQCACYCGQNGYQYASLQLGFMCYCDNVYATHGTSDDCTEPCADDPQEQCGDQSGLVGSVYETSIGCTPACSGNQTCTNFGGFYWCTPDCDFSVSLTYDLPCGSSGEVSLVVTGTNPFSQAFNVSLDGGNVQNGTFSHPLTYTFNVGDTHSFTVNNLFGCSVNKSLTLPTPSLPNAMEPPTPIFDVSTMNLDVLWYKLVYPSRTGGLQLDRYAVDYRYHCPGSSFSAWARMNSTDSSSESLQIPFEYGLEYETKVNAENCLGAGPSSSVATSLAPTSPYQPLITDVFPENGVPTTGGIVTLSGQYFTNAPTLHANDVAISPSSGAASEIVVTLAAGSGNVKFNVIATFNYPCQTLTSPDFTWAYSRPTIANTSVLSNAGGVLIINGTNFGASGDISVGIDETLCGNCSRTIGHTQITCSSCPAGNGDGHELKVEVAGLVSDAYSFTFAICDPMCVFGECVGNDVCSCEAGYGGNDCSEVHVCAGTQAFTESTCGECTTDSSTCCVFKS